MVTQARPTRTGCIAAVAASSLLVLALALGAFAAQQGLIAPPGIDLQVGPVHLRAHHAVEDVCSWTHAFCPPEFEGPSRLHSYIVIVDIGTVRSGDPLKRNRYIYSLPLR